MVGKPGELDEARFRVHVSPSRVEVLQPDGRAPLVAKKSAAKGPEGGFMSYYSVVVCVETLVQKGAGFCTPISLLYAVDFFAKAFGFDIDAKAWSRSKRLALRYKGQRGERRPAKSFSGETLRALEKMVKDDMLKKPLRVASGKLRLCVQASIRHDDLLNTPISALEWTRRKGGLGIVALRSRALRGKNKARLWIASIKGASKEGDGWLDCLLKLLLESYGSSWKVDDHSGARDMESWTNMPATIGGGPS